jgi:hypothetical protein
VLVPARSYDARLSIPGKSANTFIYSLLATYHGCGVF